MLNIRLTTIASGPVNTVPVTPDLPTAAVMTTPLPVVEDLGTCPDCGAEMTSLVNDKGEVRAVFCEYCEFGNF
ncbi:hypothetical protein ABT300_18790 [Streptomyces sp. NPDC001027]|uniref:hypothetical protein n=1 Tax=Streptomyces sp. NPDC001027 TaxID=3154771 RepID=UPI003329E653